MLSGHRFRILFLNFFPIGNGTSNESCGKVQIMILKIRILVIILRCHNRPLGSSRNHAFEVIRMLRTHVALILFSYYSIYLAPSLRDMIVKT
jgi:hypothetical protein